MNWALTALLCAFLVELVLHLPFAEPLKKLGSYSKRSLRVVTVKGVSDHWKEKAMLAYAGKTFVASMKVAGLLGLVLGIAAVLVIGIGLLLDGFQAFVLSWTGLGLSIIVASLYLVARKAILDG